MIVFAAAVLIVGVYVLILCLCAMRGRDSRDEERWEQERRTQIALGYEPGNFPLTTRKVNGAAPLTRPTPRPTRR